VEKKEIDWSVTIGGYCLGGVFFGEDLGILMGLGKPAAIGKREVRRRKGKRGEGEVQEPFEERAKKVPLGSKWSVCVCRAKLIAPSFFSSISSVRIPGVPAATIVWVEELPPSTSISKKSDTRKAYHEQTPFGDWGKWL